MTVALSVFDPLDHSVSVYDPDGTLVYANPVTDTMLGRNFCGMVGRSVWDMFPDAIGGAFHIAFEEVRRTGQAERFDNFYPPVERWFRNHVYRRDGKIFVVATDITAAKRAEARLTALARASETFATVTDVPLAFQSIARVLAEQLGDSCVVYLALDHETKLQNVASHHVDPEVHAWLRELATTPFAVGQGLSARVFPDGEALLVPVIDKRAHVASVQQEPHRSGLEKMNVHSFMAVPLRDHDRPIGLIAMARDRTSHPYTAEDLALLKDLAGRAGLALSRAHLFQTERFASSALAESNRMLEAVVSSAPTAILLMDPDGTVRLWNATAEHVFGWLAAEALGRFHPGVPPERRDEFLANLAIVAAGQPITGFETKRRTRNGGIIDVETWAAPVAYPDGRVQCLSVVVDISDRRRETARGDLLVRASTVLSSSLEVDEVLRQLAWLAVPEVADWCSIDILRDDDSIDTVAVAHADPAQADVAQRLQRRLTPRPHAAYGVSRVIDDASGQLVREVNDNVIGQIAQDETHAACLRAMKMKSFVCAPLIVAGRSLGALTFVSSSRTYDASDLALVEELARRAAAVLENTRLYGRMRALVRRLENIQGVTSELSRARTPEDVASVTVRHGTQAVQAEACAVWMADEGGGLRLTDGYGIPESDLDSWRTLPADSGVPAVSVLQTGAPLWVETEDDYRRVAPTIFERQNANGRARAFAALPLTIDGRRRGVVVFSFPLGHRFSEEDRQFLATLSRQCEQALERAQLFVRQADARREAEQARQTAEAASRAKDEFLAMLGHELRNPLAPIATALQLMKLRGDTQSSREQQVIERQVAHLLRLVDDLLDVSRITRGKVVLKKEPIDLADAVAKAVEMASPLFEQRRHQLTVTIPREGMRLEGDMVRLAQVIANLLTNAAKYTDPGGIITLQAQRKTAALPDSGRPNGSGGEWPAERLVIRVRDNGSGIEPDLLPSVFDLFTQGARSSDRSQGGLGIGLTLVRNLVQMHGGTVSAHSDGPGKGSEFIVELPALPLREIAVEELPSFTRQHISSTRPRRILLVDDNADAADLLADYLRDAGHEVALAYDGVQALKVLETFKPEVALLDIGLPVMDGYELAVRLQQRFPIRMAALTGYGQDHDRARSMGAGFDAHFVKPVAPEDLLRYVDERTASSP